MYTVYRMPYTEYRIPYTIYRIQYTARLNVVKEVYI